VGYGVYGVGELAVGYFADSEIIVCLGDGDFGEGFVWGLMGGFVEESWDEFGRVCVCIHSHYIKRFTKYSEIQR
jgi:hypothetical protein